ncbi:hypothetical protein [Gordonia polyisoprenivorans]|uniref:hypothetical protein n=1 Tax=Gordonia polyisoprenivorans TaxID=84595 RepID=UPI001AD6AA27|nr:hypothetical protein [Gordonia polyisoprenivorans]QTI69964.1 hypothetical protein J6U32_05055 [Gordonia polyisoprenivorans]
MWRFGALGCALGGAVAGVLISTSVAARQAAQVLFPTRAARPSAVPEQPSGRADAVRRPL